MPTRSCKEAPGQVAEEAEATWVGGKGGVRQAPVHLRACPGALEQAAVPWRHLQLRLALAPVGAGSQPQTRDSGDGSWGWGGRWVELFGGRGRQRRFPSPGTHYIRGVNNTRQPWHSSEGRKQYSLKPANPTEEGLASLHSVLFRKQPFLWRAALLYYTIERASRLSFSALFQDLEQYVQDAGVRWEYCVRAKRGQTDTSQPGTVRGRGLQSLGVSEGI